jgi:hypothetical protein
MSPTELRPVPPPNRQPLWLFWTRRYIARAIIRIGFGILRVGVWIHERGVPRPTWIFRVAMWFLRLATWMAPRRRGDRVPQRRM